MFNPDNPYDGVWRDLATSVDVEDPELHAGLLDHGIPSVPIETRIDGPYGLPWFDGLEDPYERVELAQSPTPLPWSPNEDIGGEPMVADYTGAYRTRGPIVAFGHEPSGGLDGDQAIGRIMRFPANIPDRFDPYGVFNTDPRDDLAAAMAVEDMTEGSTAEITTNLLQWPNVWGRW